MDERQQLEQQIARLREQNEKLVQEAKALAADSEQLKQEKQKLSEKLLKSQTELEALIGRIFGRKSERFNDEDPKSGRVAEVIAKAKAEKRKSILAKMWAYRGTSVPINVFDFTVSRHRDGPDLFLIDHDYRGVLLGDCCGANTGIYVRSNGLVVHAARVAHARRKAEYALDNHAEHAKFLRRSFRDLYDTEDEGRCLTAEARLGLRQARSVPILSRLRDYLENDMQKVSSKQKNRRSQVVSAQSVGRPDCAPAGRSHPDRQQRLRTVDEAGRPGQQKLVVCRQRPCGLSQRGPHDDLQQRDTEQPGRVCVREGRARPTDRR